MENIKKKISVSGRNPHYPNCLLYTQQKLINPYDEKVMSLNKDSFYDNDTFELNEIYFNNGY